MSDSQYLLSLLNHNDESTKSFFVDYINSINPDIFSFAKLLVEKKFIKEQRLLRNTLLPLAEQAKQYSKEIGATCPFELLAQLGDLHNHGRCTALVSNKNQKIIYKPISTGMLSFINEAFGLLNNLNVKTVCFIEQTKNYSLIKYINPEICVDPNKYALHYGAMLFVIALLRGIDFHHENFLCIDSTPVVIDCESLLYPVITETKEYTLEASLLIPTESNRQSVINNIKLPTEKILDGVQEACLSITQQVKTVKELIIKYSTKKNRIIFKPTRFYATTIKNSTHPNFLLDENKRKNYISNCLKGSRSISKAIANSELEELLNFNVPYFYKEAENLCGYDGRSIEQNFISDSTKLILNNLDNLNAFELELMNQIKINISKFSDN